MYSCLMEAPSTTFMRLRLLGYRLHHSTRVALLLVSHRERRPAPLAYCAAGLAPEGGCGASCSCATGASSCCMLGCGSRAGGGGGALGKPCCACGCSALGCRLEGVACWGANLLTKPQLGGGAGGANRLTPPPPPP
jgi:hypothetical protein